MTESRTRLCVLTVIDCMMTSGAEILATQIAVGLDPSRFESIICSTRSSAPEHVATARAAGIEVLELGRGSKVDVWRWLPLIRLLRTGRVDIVHAHKFGSNVWTAVLSQLAPVPVLLAHEHTWSFEGKPLRDLSGTFLERAGAYDWPGNIRELENMVERALILADGELLFPAAAPAAGDAENLEDVERSHIRSVLERTRWVIEGDKGAARILGLNPSTLRGRLRKLGIRKTS